MCGILGHNLTMTATDPKTILGIFAHPDDESMGPGATFAKYAAAGHRVAFVTATDGGAGRLYQERPADNATLRDTRRRETAEAAKVLGIEFLGFLGWEDGGLDKMNVLDIEVEFARIIRREKPDVLITFHGSGISYHPDHRVVSTALNSASLGSAWARWYKDPELASLAPHRVSKLYQFVTMQSMMDRIQWPREIYAAPDNEVSAVIDTRDTADTKWRAILAHDSQRDGPPFKMMYDAGIFAKEAFVRVVPTWLPGDARESDLLEGLI